MPRVHLYRKKYMKSDFSKWLTKAFIDSDKKRAELAEVLGITPQALNYKIRNVVFDYEELVTVFDFFKTEDADIIKIMKGRRI